VIVKITITARLDLGKCVTATGNIFRDSRNGVFDFFSAVRLAFARLDQTTKSLRINTFNGAFNAYITEGVTLAFVNRNCDRVFVGRWIKRSIR